jgi:SNF2 family DNA or RNA helicase
MDMHSPDFDYAAYYAGEGGENSPLGKAMGIMTCMEMFIDHPDLLILSGQRVEAGDTGSSYAYRIWQDGLLDSIFDSPKMVALKEKLEDILEYPDSKVLIYTKYRHMLPILQDSISAGSVLFHGQMNSRQRTDAVSQFREDSNTRLFLSSHAGAYGMDMSMANYLVNYDLAWSSGRADQINGRHVRASSEFGKVYIRNLVMKNTLDMYKLGLLRLKRSIMTEALDGHGGDDAGRVEMSQVSLSRHLTDAVTYGILR